MKNFGFWYPRFMTWLRDMLLAIGSMSFVLVKSKPKSRQRWIEKIDQVIESSMRVKLSTKEAGDIAHYWFFHRHLYPILLAVIVIGLVTWGAIEIHLTDSLLAVVDFASSLVRGN